MAGGQEITSRRHGHAGDSRVQQAAVYQPVSQPVVR